ncbi:uroporphyrinogen decarboxylase (URO-D) [Oxobacter pfennigii]|uniref:Uroporphyrinogen decarboxylase (URO-D) n=1 Tax=Oxobacter pfennigii TaxID=36849 RepID=A0A0P8YBB0_9CLOT|nr:uroporphyrinogen decarboxylase family protein [Oxobacter pfennigii]KPU44340.1 uroporphyrinogen decarboxylase (URO-D) [Oxobacter pfennigii]
MDITTNRRVREQSIPKSELLKEREENLLKTVRREKHDYIPTLAHSGAALVHYAGKTLREVQEDIDKCTDAFLKAFDDLYCDCSIALRVNYSIHSRASLGENTQNYLGPDGVTIEHVQKSFMKEDEYPLLIKDANKFVKDVMVKRKYPFLYVGDSKKAVKAIQTLVDDSIYSNIILGPHMAAALREKYAVTTMNLGYLFQNPLDSIFDHFRGFQGCLIDLRRRKGEVKEACDHLWQTNSNRLEKIDRTYPFVTNWPHIPTYLSPKQFEELYWPYTKMAIENCKKSGQIFYFSAEGSWLKFMDYFRDIPKDSVIIHCDNDDTIEMSKKIGDWQIIAGGCNLARLRTCSKQVNIDYAKRVIDECAHTNAFIFTADRTWVCPGDINQNLLDVYEYVYENGKY